LDAYPDSISQYLILSQEKTLNLPSQIQPKERTSFHLKAAILSHPGASAISQTMRAATANPRIDEKAME
jgi:hypothetical protein